MPLHEGPIPKHYQITEILRGQITSGQLQPGDQIPTEAQLCREFGVSRGTVRKAFTNLAHQGLIRSEQGRGTFVIAPKSSSLFLCSTTSTMKC